MTLLAAACRRHGAELLVDAYHHLNVVPFDVGALGLEAAFVTGGGYKYCQLGEGNGFLRVPPGCRLRPVVTGWFGESAELEAAVHPGAVQYGVGAARFAGATYDPTSHYRAAAVFAFHGRLGLSPERLRAISVHQVGLLDDGFRRLDLDPARAAIVDIAAGRRAGFLAIRTSQAAALVPALRAKGLFTNARGCFLRLGPAPYLSDDQLQSAVRILGDELRQQLINPTD